jgi:putative addiction module antidote
MQSSKSSDVKIAAKATRCLALGRINDHMCSLPWPHRRRKPLVGRPIPLHLYKLLNTENVAIQDLCCSLLDGLGSAKTVPHVGITDVITSRFGAMHTLKLTQIGNSVGVILPKEVLNRLDIEKGDEIFLTDSPDGLRLTVHNPAFEAQMRAARDIMKARRSVLRELAK